MGNLTGIDPINRIGGWERLVIFSGVILSAVLIGLIGVAIFAIAHDRPGAYFSIIIIILCMLFMWVIIWGALWIVSGMRQKSAETARQKTLSEQISELQQENERLKQQLAELSSKPEGG